MDLKARVAKLNVGVLQCELQLIQTFDLYRSVLPVKLRADPVDLLVSRVRRQVRVREVRHLDGRKYACKDDGRSKLGRRGVYLGDKLVQLRLHLRERIAGKQARGEISFQVEAPDLCSEPSIGRILDDLDRISGRVHC